VSNDLLMCVVASVVYSSRVTHSNTAYHRAT